MNYLICLSIVLVAAFYCNANDEKVDIIDGSEASKNQFPFQVSLQVKLLLGIYYHNCGGSIVNKRWIVTAAHCTSGKNVSDLRVLAGIISLSDSNAQKIGVSEIIIHEGYPGGSVESPYDISLVKLTNLLNYGDNVKPVILPNKSPAVGNATVIGWGATSLITLFVTPDKLSYTNVSVLSSDECERLVTSIEGKSTSFNKTRNICSVPEPNGNQAPCNGDSGGGLIRDNNTLIGIVSWRVDKGFCGTTGYASVYINVAAYSGWIQNNTKLTENDN